MRALWALWALWAAALLFAGPVAADGVCACECCVRNQCNSVMNATAAVEHCALCSSEFCRATYEECSVAGTVTAQCVDRSSLWTELVAAGILLFVGLLGVLSCLRAYPFMAPLLVRLSVHGFDGTLLDKRR